jgi:transposase
VLVGEAVAEPKSADGRVEMIRLLRSARRSAVKARCQAANQLQSLLVTAPEDLRHRLRQLSTKELVATCARFRLGSDPEDVRTATRVALRSVARRLETLSEEIAELDAQLDRLVAEVAPGLISRRSVRITPRRCLSLPETTLRGWVVRRLSPAFAQTLPSRLLLGRSSAIGST